MWPFKKKRRSKSNYEAPEIEARGQKLLEKIARAPHKEPWFATLMMLAWTAGPVTVIAAVGGYYVGYGTLPPIERTIYFFAYAMIAGLLGLAAKLLYSIFHSRKEEQDEDALLEVMDRLPELIYMVRDLKLENLSNDARKIEAAGILLNKMDLGPEGFYHTVEELTGNTQLARQAECIEIYRRAGLYNRMHDLVTEISADTQASYNTLKQSYPKIAELLLNRLQGQVTNVRQGVSREPLFIERILAAIEKQEEALITLSDVEEILILCFELLCNRHITYLQMEFTGDWSLARSLDRLEKEKNNFRISYARIYSRLRALTTYLNYVEPQKNIQSAAGLSTRALLNSALDAINTLSQQVAETNRHTLHSSKNVMSLQIKAMHLNKAIKLYHEVHKAYEQQSRDGRRFSRTLKIWQMRSKEYESKSVGSLRRGLRISEQEIALTDLEKVAIAEQLSRYLQESKIQRASSRSDENTKNNTEKRLTLTRARELAIEITLILEPFIDLKSPEVQRAIDTTHASNLNAIQPGMNPMTKAALGKGIADAVEKNLSSMAERLAQNLVRYYRVPLTDGMIDFLSRTYNADKDRLQFIAEHETPSGSQHSASLIPFFEMPEVSRSWLINLRNAYGTINRYL